MTTVAQALKEHLLLVAAVLIWICVQAYPELMQNRIDPYDAALFAANGAIFHSAFQELGNLLAQPVNWLYDYYNQYPALAVRRHPPLFGITEAMVYGFTGVSVFGAKLTAFIYSIAFAIGIYALSFRIWRDALLAGATAFLVMATPQVAWLGTAVRLDLPSLTFAIWALFHYVGYLKSNHRSAAIYFAILAVLSVYTYQLAVFVIAGACLHLVILRKADLLKDRTAWIAAGILVVCILPLVIEQLYVAKDNLTAATGGEIEEWKRFHPIESRFSAEFFLFYPIVWLNNYPVQTLGLLAWLISVVRRGITREDFLLLLCAACAFAFFTWMRGKEPRYAIYTMAPLVLLAAQGIRNLISGANQVSASTAKNRVAAGVIVVLGLLQFYFVATPNFYLSGMDRPAHGILSINKNARILYSGSRDAAFIFYVRQFDQERAARIFRATVQIKNPADIAEFVEKHRIDFIALEDEKNRVDTDGFVGFRDALGNYIQMTGAPVSTFEYQLDLKSLKEERQIKLNVYQLKAK